MDDGHRKLMLIALVAALVAGWLAGWFFGPEMKSALDARVELGEVSRELQQAQSPPEAGAGVPAVKGLEQRKESLRESLDARYHWYLFYRLSDFAGSLFLNLLNMLVIPLVAASLITGVTRLGDIRHVGRTGLRTVVYYLATTSVAVVTGMVMVQLIRPGAGVSGSSEVAERVAGKAESGVLDTLLSVFVGPSPGSGAVPSNVFSAMAETNVLGVIFFSLLLGSALTTLGEKGRPVVDFFEGLNDAVLKMIHWVLYLLPAGVFGLVVGRLVETGGGAAVWAELQKIGFYALTVTGALVVHAVVVLPLLLWLLTGRNPVRYASGMVQALFTAFSTASSSATLPTTMECVEVNNRISARSASFVLPIGATVNMDGTALYEAVAVIFIAQVYGVELGSASFLVIFLTATLAAVGAAGIPEAGLVTMVIVLNATGLPLEGVAMLLSIDWLLDRFRTTVNVWGDAVGAAVVDRFEEAESAPAPAP